MAPRKKSGMFLSEHRSKLKRRKKGLMLQQWRRKNMSRVMEEKAATQVSETHELSDGDESASEKTIEPGHETFDKLHSELQAQVSGTFQASKRCGVNTDGKDIREGINDNASCVEDTTHISQCNSGESSVLSGRRLVDIGYFIQEMQKISNHGPFGCTLADMDIIGETRKGYKTCITFKCRMCNLVFKVSTDNPHTKKMDVNTSAVCGIMAIGAGFSQLQEFSAALDVPSMSNVTYDRYHDRVSDGWEAAALREMQAAVEEEITLAVERGDVDSGGVPLLTVVADGSWAKRSYGCNYNSMSGTAAIVGFYTKKVLFIGVRNKYCTMCSRAAARNEEVRQHRCFKNWTQTSTSMESDIIVEGFKVSEELYGVKYATLVADGDSSVYAKILEARPYADVTVEKVECTNHLLRNYCKKLRLISINSKLKNVNLRKRIGGSIMRLRRAVTSAVKHRISQDGLTPASRHTELYKDIVNGPSHVFGEHLHCVEIGYFCTGRSAGEINIVPDLQAAGLYILIMEAVGQLAIHCRSLLRNLDSNPVEQFNSIIAKFLGGKRVNYGLKRSYNARCSAALVSHNTHTPLYCLHKEMCAENSPGLFTKLYESRRKSRLSLSRNQPPSRSRKRLRLERMSVGNMYDKDYGPSAQKPDLPPDTLQQSCKEFLQSLSRTEQERRELERSTVMQRNSGLWKQERRKLLTASHFGAVCKRKPHTGCEKLVKTLLYSDWDSEAMRYGREKEVTAIEYVEKALNVTITKCGLFVDPKIPYLGASPDGLVGEDGIVEIKCPFSAKHMTPADAISTNKVTFWKYDKEFKVSTVNTKHNYYYQVQGQLHVTRRRYCIFALWTQKGAKIEYIQRDDEFWKENMEKHLHQFYVECLLPELVDPRFTRSMPIRNPSRIIQAQNRMKMKMSTRKEKKTGR